MLSLYERNGYFDEIISLMEAGLGLERAHMVRPFYSHASGGLHADSCVTGHVHRTECLVRQVPTREACVFLLIGECELTLGQSHGALEALLAACQHCTYLLSQGRGGLY